MAFIAQVRLSDVPGLERFDAYLLSFHYCEACAFAGDMSFGWQPLNPSPHPIPFPSLGQRIVSRLGIAPVPTFPIPADSQSYDTSIFTSVDGTSSDRVGIAADSPVHPQELSATRISEIPSEEDYPEDLDGLRDAFEFAHLSHVDQAKLGGWPSWAQRRQVPPGPAGSSMQFVAQLDASIAEKAAWGGGGYAYLFADLSSAEASCAQLVIQTT